METVQVVLEADLLRDVDRATKRLKVNRSALAYLSDHLNDERR